MKKSKTKVTGNENTEIISISFNLSVKSESIYAKPRSKWSFYTSLTTLHQPWQPTAAVR